MWTRVIFVDKLWPTMSVCQTHWLYLACTPEIFVSHVLLDLFQSRVSPDVISFPLPSYISVSWDYLSHEPEPITSLRWSLIIMTTVIKTAAKHREWWWLNEQPQWQCIENLGKSQHYWPKLPAVCHILILLTSLLRWRPTLGVEVILQANNQLVCKVPLHYSFDMWAVKNLFLLVTWWAAHGSLVCQQLQICCPYLRASL